MKRKNKKIIKKKKSNILFRQLPKTKCCTEKNMSGSGFQIPYGYVDLKGLNKITDKPIIYNINYYNKPKEEEYIKVPIIEKKPIEIFKEEEIYTVPIFERKPKQENTFEEPLEMFIEEPEYITIPTAISTPYETPIFEGKKQKRIRRTERELYVDTLREARQKNLINISDDEILYQGNNFSNLEIKRELKNLKQMLGKK